MHTKTHNQRFFKSPNKQRKSGMIKPLFTIILLTLLGACSLFKVRGSGNIVSETRDVHDFSRVVFSGTGELMLTQGEEEALTISADDNLMIHIESEIKGDTLYISHKDTILPSQPIHVELSVKNLEALQISGLIHAETRELTAEQLAVEINGISDLKMGMLEADRLTITLNGTARFEMTDESRVNRQEVVLNGSNTYDASKLQSQETDISINGSGDATLWADAVLNIKTSGNGSISYYGNPQISQTGSGRVDLNSLGSP